MKKYTRLLSAPLMLAFALFLCLGLSTPSAQATESDFKIIGAGVLEKYNGPGGDVVIPDGVTFISVGAFQGRTDITSVMIPNSVTSIGTDAFSGCTHLTSVNIPEGLEEICYGAFLNCTGLTNVDIPNSVTHIGEHCFEGCTSLTSVVIPNSVTYLGQYSFVDCTSLENVIISDSVNEMDGIFSGCTGLTSVVIPESVTSIDNITFGGCTSLTSIVIPESVTHIGDSAFRGCTSLTNIIIPISAAEADFSISTFQDTPWGKKANQGDFLIAGSILLKYYGSQENVIIPEGVTTIGEDAFLMCESLASVEIPDSVTTIKQWAFAGCNSLTNVVFPDSVTNIGRDAFSYTAWERESQASGDEFWMSGNILLSYQGSGGEAVIPDGITVIAGGAFENCTNLTGVMIPDSVTNIGDSAFRNCTGLTNIDIPEKVVNIGEFAFYGCTGLTSVTVPDSVTTIGQRAFSDCTDLISIVVPNSVTSIGDYAFSDCPNLMYAVLPITDVGNIPRGENLKSIWLSNITEIPSYTFSGCTNLEKLFLPNVTFNVTLSKRKYVYPYVFRGCMNPKFTVYGVQDADYYAYVAGHKAVTAYADAKGRHNYVSPQSGVIVSKSNEICAGLTTDYEKIRAVYTWMAENIAYDYDYYEDRKNTVITDPEGVLNCKLTVCAGYAKLTQALLQAQGIPTMYITGPAFGPKGWETHAWNAAYIKEQGRWSYLDSTWSKDRRRLANGEIVENGAKYDYFDISPYAFATDHHADPMPSETFTVSPNRSTVLVNGKKVEFESYEIGGNNYFKLRDLAAALSGTEKQFDVTWDNEKQAVNLVTDHPYTFVAGELVPGDGQAKQAKVNASETYLNGQRLFLPAYEIHGNNYVKLRDIADIVDFGVLWDNASKTVVIDSTTGYSV